MTSNIPPIGSDFTEHQEVVYNMCKAYKTKTILELGVRDGASTAAFLLYCKSFKAHLTSIDRDMPHRTIRGFVEATGLDDYWTFILSDDTVPNLLPSGQKYDVVFIDTSHEYDHTKIEFEMYAPLAKKLILLHDTELDFNGKPTGVEPAAREYCAAHGLTFSKFTNQYGLGIIQIPFSE